MDCSSTGNSSGSLSIIQNQSSSSEQELMKLLDLRKRKRMQSNRESARRSRMRKQQHLDGLMAQLGQLIEHKNLMVSRINLTANLFLNVESENSVLRAQILELTHRLDSLNQILSQININSSNNNNNDEEQELEEEEEEEEDRVLQNFHDFDFDFDFGFDFDFDRNPLFLNSLLPIVASADHHVLH